MNTAAMLLVALTLAAPRQDATALLVGQLTATQPTGTYCTLQVEVGAGAPIPVLVDPAALPGACSYPDGARLRIKARVVAAYFVKIGPRFWFEATEVRAR